MGIRVLGPTAVDDSPSLSPRDRAVLGALVVERGSVTSPDRLAEALWGDAVPDSWRKVVQNSIVRLRRVLGPTAIETTPDGYRLALAAEDVDAWRFERFFTTAQSLAQLGESDRVAYTLDRALQLWQGEPLQDLDGWPPASAEVARWYELRRTSEERLAEALLDVGEHEQVLARARALTAAEPLRERRWELLALALYRSGQQGEALRVLSHARRILRDELGVEPRADLLSLEQAILDHDPALMAAAVRAGASERCPYKGLEPYDVDDEHWFFGREAIVESCRRRLAHAGVLVVAGRSGSGKSSLVRAGLIPRTRADGRAVALCTPGSDALGALAAALSVTGRDAALVVDQAEELFTLCDDGPQRTEFARAVADHAVRQPVVLVLRADHIASTAAHRELSRMVEAGLFLVSPMNESELRDAIEEPARLAGCRLETGLVDLLVRDVLDEPGALPLLSHALVETWMRREGAVLTVAGYRDAGGVRGAVARTAERLYEALPDAQRVLARALLLRLVETTERDVVRHPVSTHAFGDEPEERAVVNVLLAARLITVGEDTMEIAHESLATAWPRLRSWLDEDREGQRIRQHLGAAAAGWDALGRDPSELYRGARLQSALGWTDAAGESLTSVERAFLDAGADRERREEDELRARAAAEARSNRRLRRSLRGVAILLACALIAAAVAVAQFTRAEGERDRAAASARKTAVRNVVSQSLQLRETRRDLAALLAVAGYRLAPGPDTESALFATFTGSPGFAGHLRSHAEPYRSGVFLPGGHRLAILDLAGELRIYDADRLVEIEHVTVAPANTVDSMIAVSRDGSTLAIATDTGTADRPGELRVLDPATLQPRFETVHLNVGVRSVAVSPDGALIASSGGSEAPVEIRDARTGARVAGVAPQTDSSGAVTAVALGFSAPNTLVVAAPTGRVQIFDARTGELLAKIVGPPGLTGPKYEGEHAQAARTVVVTGDGRAAITSGPGGTMRWDLASRETSWLQPSSQSCRSVAVVEASNAVLCGVGDGRSVALDFGTGTTRAERYEGIDGLVNELAVSDDGRVLAVVTGSDISRHLPGDAGGSAGVWRLDGTGPIQRKLGSGPVAFIDGYDPTGNLLLVGAPRDATKTRLVPIALASLTPGDVDLKVLEADTGAIVDELDGLLFAAWVADGVVAVLRADGTSGTYDVVRHRDITRGSAPGLGGTPGGYVADPEHQRFIVWDAAGHVQILTQDESVKVLDLPATSSFWLAWMLGITPDGNTLVGASFEHGLQSFDVATGARIAGPRDEYRQVVMHPQGDAVAWTRDDRISVFDPATLEPRAEPTASLGPILFLEFSDDGRQMLIVRNDRSYQLVDWPTRTALGDPVAWSAGLPSPWSYPDLRGDGGQLALPGMDGITLWDLDRPTWIDRACALAGRELTDDEWQEYLSAFGSRRDVCA